MMRLLSSRYTGLCAVFCCVVGISVASVDAATPLPRSPGVPSPTCRPGFNQQGFWLCMTGIRGMALHSDATVFCQDIGGRLADVNDWRYRIFRGDGISAPVGTWFGNRTGNDRALFANSFNPANPD